MNIGDLFFMFRGESTQLMSDSVAAGKAAGDAGGKSYGQQFKAAAGAAIGAGVGVAIGAMLAGANQLDTATRKLQADTGMTAEEAKRAEHSLADMYRNNLQGFAEIGDAMAAVHNDLGLTGEAADAATRKILRFATATGQNAADAVGGLDDVMDNWGLTADDMQAVMDKLIVSHQKWGGNIADNEKTLAALAPAMKAANFEIDDGVALLGLFGAKGLDANTASAAFAKALTKVKSPEELQRLITEITNTTDPFKRASLAADLFGARAGAKLANALAGAKLDDYTVGMDEAKGATDRAAAAIESGFGAQFQLLMKNAGGALAEFGTQFGPLVTLASTVGPKMLGAIGAGLGGAAGLLTTRLAPKLGVAFGGAITQAGAGSLVKGSLGKLGDLWGSKLGLAMKGAFILALGAIILELKGQLDELDARIDSQAKGISLSVDEQIAKGMDLTQTKAALEQGIHDLSGVFGHAWVAGDEIRALQADLAKVNAAIAGSFQDSSKASSLAETRISAAAADSARASVLGGVQISSALGKVKTSAIEEAAEFDRTQRRIRSTVDATRAKLVEQAQAMIDGFFDPLELRAALHDTRLQVLADIDAVRTAKTKEQKRQASAVAIQALDDEAGALAALGGQGKLTAGDVDKYSSDVTGYYKAMGKAVPPEIQAVIDHLREVAKIKATPTVTVKYYGAEKLSELAKQLGYIGNTDVYKHFPGNNPFHAKGGPVEAGAPSIVGEEGPEMWVPRTAGYVIPHPQTMAILAGADGSSGGNTYNIQLPVGPAPNPFETAMALKRLADFGVLR